jgi:hypothetical protein
MLCKILTDVTRMSCGEPDYGRIKHNLSAERRAEEINLLSPGGNQEEIKPVLGGNR